jgi:hypothetical protein
MMTDRFKALALPITLLLAFEIWARTVQLHSDSLAPPSAVLVALGQPLPTARSSRRPAIQ